MVFFLNTQFKSVFPAMPLLAWVMVGFMPVAALAFDLTVPVDCRYGDECVISQYVDTNPELEEEPQDYTCGRLTSEGNQSTRFMLRDSHEMYKGVSVLAAEDGVITHRRDGMNDVSIDLAGTAAVRGRECGNGIVIEHRRGFITEYCHLMKDSLLVEVGDKVRKGSRIALVGMSGHAAYPQLEFSVRRRDDFFDPFLGDEPLRCGSVKAYPLWDRDARKKLNYIPTMLLNAHFVNKVPYSMGAREGKFRMDAIHPKDDKLVFWIDMFGIQKGDTLLVQLISPTGKILDDEERSFLKDKHRHFQFIGQKREGAAWQKGEYIGKVRLERVVNSELQAVVDEVITISVEEPVAQ